MPLKKIYLAIPYTGMHKSSFKQATDACMAILKMGGYNVYSPITHSHPLHMAGLAGDWEFWQEIDLQFIDWADEVWVLVPKEGILRTLLSTGVVAEIKYAQKHKKPIQLIQLIDNQITFYDT